MSDRQGEVRCNATAANRRCDFRGTRDQLLEHATETTHKLCRCCRHSLRNAEPVICDECVRRTRDNLGLIVDAYARMSSTVETAGYRNEPIPGGTAMVLLAGGDIDGGGPDDHIDFHDPIDPLAVLEHNERDWRNTFGHGPAVELATVESCVTYLLTWLHLAARTHPAFDEFVGEIRTLAIRLTHTTGQANDPKRASARCIDCNGVLVSPYREPTQPAVVVSRLTAIVGQRQAEKTYGLPLTPLAGALGRRGLDREGREMIGDDEPETVWECRDCGAVFSPVEYRLAVRIFIEAQAEKAG